MPLFALVDCNNFFASCERVFVPALRNRPVVVLSNNDGCVIARSAEAKALGIRMGQPAFECARLCQRHGVAVFSSNYALYGDMSARVMAVLAGQVPALEVYSIDEAFLVLSGLPGDPVERCRAIREEVYRRTGMPVSVGLGNTKTLAKAANREAKKNPVHGGVFSLAGHPNPAQILGRLPVEDVWGIGPRQAARLKARGVASAAAFAALPRDWVRKAMTVTGLHTLLELSGIPCFPPGQGPEPRKSVLCSRSFGRPVTTLEEMEEAVAVHASRAAEKLRSQGSVASCVLAFVQTSRFVKGAPAYANAFSQALPSATAHTPALIRAALSALGRIFRPGLAYKKAGVMLTGLEQADARQLSLFDLDPPGGPEPRGREAPLMAALDRVNARFGREALRFAATGLARPWGMKQARRSPRFTTVWEELPEVRA
jgi:DNA polymerase V